MQKETTYESEAITEAERARFQLIEHQVTAIEIIEAEAAFRREDAPYGYMFEFTDGSYLWVTPEEIEVL